MSGFFPSSTVQKEKPIGLVPKCGACGLLSKCESPKMPVYGRGECKVMVVGEAPGATEDEENRPFVGKAGQFLRDRLKTIGVNLDRDAWTTNALICRPPENATPDAKQIQYCRPNLLKAIETHRPLVIVPLGRTALQSVLTGYWNDVRTLERWVGWKIPLEKHWVCPTYHPSYLLRMKNSLLDRIFTDHLETAFSIEEPAPKQPDWKSRIEILFDGWEIAKALAWFVNAGGWVAVDYETNCLKPECAEAKIWSFAISNGKRTISFPWTAALAKLVSPFLQQKHLKYIASNLKMEERWTRKFLGHGVANWGWDTMLAAHCLDNREGICSLKFQAFVKLGVPVYNENVEPYLESSNGPYNRIHEIDIKTLLLYGGYDVILEYFLAMRQRKEIGCA